VRLSSSLLDSAPSRLNGMTVDEPFGPSPNRSDSASGTISAEKAFAAPFWLGRPKLLGIPGLATHGLRTSTKNDFSLSAARRQVKEAARFVHKRAAIVSPKTRRWMPP
jgi:hypothetical protein